MNHLVYHKADLDGHCAAAVVLFACPGSTFNLIPTDYGDRFPWGEIHEGDTVVMVDFSLWQTKGAMERLAKMCNLTWIDHHKSAIEDYTRYLATGNAPFKHACTDSTRAACILAWEWFMGTPVPLAVQLLGQYDVFDFHDPWALPFQYACRYLLTKGPTHHDWRGLLVDNRTLVERLVLDGTRILEYQKAVDQGFAQDYAYDILFEGYDFLAMNKRCNSQAFDAAWRPDYHDGKLAFFWTGEMWRVSLFSDSIDVSELAKKHGGGGHKGAAGFECAELPPELLGREP